MKITSTSNVTIKARRGDEGEYPATMKKHPVKLMSARAVALLAAEIDKGFVGLVMNTFYWLGFALRRRRDAPRKPKNPKNPWWPGMNPRKPRNPRQGRYAASLEVFIFNVFSLRYFVVIAVIGTFNRDCARRPGY